jgi:hypothetical protein
MDTAALHNAANVADKVAPVVTGFWNALYTVILGIGVVIGVIGKIVHTKFMVKKTPITPAK